ncbi:DUF3667 domain-containing protein [Silanimonas sp.]|jgi:hypothetical protein|uniref:DUF3667 domain-containing protein n=1 Tax=Silanimonas sp. TaxID=1929290 RepID=UPI0022C61995|nr:DUF3667 domain-containing protein [Silanimonas sp.]MCZ8061632.1 DUF3667 domain-containing protein [Silanimonas sp.]
MTTPTDAHCRNCGSPLYGEHCYACGQPTKGLVRHFSSILGDVADTIFNIDGRLLRTLPALLLKPGFLTREYIEGHRVRYVSPVRLFVFLCIGTFFAAKLATPSFEIGRDDAVRVAGTDAVVLDPDGNEGFEEIDTVEGVEARMAEVRAEFAASRKESEGVPGMRSVLDATEKQVEAAAAARIAELRASEGDGGAPATRESSPGFSVDENSDTPDINFNGKPWDAETNPLVIESLPDGVNRWLNTQIGHVPQNWKRVREDPDLLRNAFYSALPTALFVLVPVFALLLKILYVYQRRLYMEHLVSALHGHAFVCAMLLVLMAMTSFESLLGSPAWLAAPMGWLEWLALAWIPAYLWLHLKRVHGQGWFATSLNFAILGFAEILLLSVVAVFALLAALVWL